MLDHKPEAFRGFEEVRYDIEGMVYDERKNAAIGTVVDELRASASIQNLEISED